MSGSERIRGQGGGEVCDFADGCGASRRLRAEAEPDSVTARLAAILAQSVRDALPAAA